MVALSDHGPDALSPAI